MPPQPPPNPSLPERLAKHVDILAGLIGQRHWWRYDQLLAAEKYIRDHFRSIGLDVSDQPFDVARKTVRNVIGTQPGVRKPDDILILGAHYDSVDPTPGADDNASGIAGVLEIARLLAPQKFKRTVRYLAFVNEEPPFYKGPDMGSLRYAQLCRARNDRIRGMINLEMIGYFDDAPGSQQYPLPARPFYYRLLKRYLPTRGDFIVLCSDFASTRFLFQFRRHFLRGSNRFPTITFPSPKSIEGPDMSDHWSFHQCGYPALMITDTSFLRNPHYHMPSDTPETLDYHRMSQVVQGAAHALAQLARPVK